MNATNRIEIIEGDVTRTLPLRPCIRTGGEFIGIESLAGLLKNVGIDVWNADVLEAGCTTV